MDGFDSGICGLSVNFWDGWLWETGADVIDAWHVSIWHVERCENAGWGWDITECVLLRRWRELAELQLDARALAELGLDAQDGIDDYLLKSVTTVIQL